MRRRLEERLWRRLGQRAAEQHLVEELGEDFEAHPRVARLDLAALLLLLAFLAARAHGGRVTK